MKPYYADDLVTLYHGDCREILPLIDVCDLLVADPPYGKDFQSGRGDHERIAGDDGSLPLSAWLPLALKRIRRGRHAYIFGAKPSDIDADTALCGFMELVWDKTVIGMGDLSSPWGPGHESILFGVQEISKANRAKGYGVQAARLRKGTVLRVQRRQSGQTLRHPTEKPVELLRILIESSSTFGEVVLDPFAGVGSTLVAAVVEGRRAVGIELKECHCESAARRLSQGNLSFRETA